MDFGTLLHMAKKNNDSAKQSSSYYSTKFAPPKKVTKEKKLSDNIQKFLQKREQEERERKRLEREKVNKLLAMRDEKSKNKIRKMLKVTKSANKSVLDDAISSDTAVTLEGQQMGDQDDYGYVSTEANAFYQKYIEKVKDVKDDKGFAPSRPLSISDLKGTKERVKAAITKEIEDKKGSSRQSSSHSSSSSSLNDKFATKTSSSSSSTSLSSRKNLYDPEAERREEERRKREEEQKRAKQRKPAPPPLDFQALLKLAEKKQHEPIAIPVEVKKPKEPERLLTSKEKKELEERKKLKEAREKRDREREQILLNGNAPKEKERKESAAPINRMEPNGRIPKLNQSAKPSSVDKNKTTLSHHATSTTNSKTTSSARNLEPINKNSKAATSSSSSSSSTAYPTKSHSTSSKSVSSTSSAAASLDKRKEMGSKSGSSNQQAVNRRPYEGPTREFPPRDVKPQTTRQFPPPDVRRSAPPPSHHQAHKRRIVDDDDEDEEDYDSEMDDFIDDGDADEDYSKHIKAIFGYDRSKYRDLDDFDDRQMESNFAQVQREELISKKIGLQEDLEDMKLEAIEKKRKMMKKKRLN